jgi:toxin ParE1/3/4
MGGETARKVSACGKAPGDWRRRGDLGEGIRSTYVGSYIIFFRENNRTLEIVRVARGDQEFPFG